MRKIIFVLSSVTLAGSALSQDTQGLYAPAPPPDSAFVRVINASTAVVSATVGGKATAAPKAGVSTYVVVPQGSVTAKSGAVSVNLPVVAGKFYSAVWTGKTFRLMTDLGAENRAKALLMIYNVGYSGGAGPEDGRRKNGGHQRREAR